MILLNFFKQGRECWCKGSFARDRHGNSVGVTNSEAVSFCLVGALARFYPEKKGFHDASIRLANTVVKAMPGISVSGFNDSASYDQLLEVLESAGV